MADIQGSSSSRLEIDYPAACLRRAGLPLQLRPKSFDVLAYLSRNRGRLVSKTELIDQIWGDIAVTENSLVQCIKDIRQVLNGDNQFEIRTVPKRALRFPSLIIASTNDPYGDLEVTQQRARDWQSGLIVAGSLGHINASSGLGDWPQGRALLDAFRAGLRR